MKVYKEAANQRLSKKGHKINTSIFYRKNPNFLPINVLYKKFNDFELKT